MLLGVTQPLRAPKVDALDHQRVRRVLRVGLLVQLELHHEVCGLDVREHEPLAVAVGDEAQRGLGDLPSLPLRQRAPLPEEPLQVPARAELHHQVRVGLVLVGAHQLHRVRAVVQRHHESHLAQQLLPLPPHQPLLVSLHLLVPLDKPLTPRSALGAFGDGLHREALVLQEVGPRVRNPGVGVDRGELHGPALSGLAHHAEGPPSYLLAELVALVQGAGPAQGEGLVLLCGPGLRVALVLVPLGKAAALGGELRQRPRCDDRVRGSPPVAGRPRRHTGPLSRERDPRPRRPGAAAT
mmetsp:Transcript_527/g.1622  ORF Transcript_527/g.1622 Transcript_527/m.1622 type:complete len:296 (-) Transcript_527:104-991(-)